MAERRVFFDSGKKGKHTVNLTTTLFLISWLTTQYRPLQLAHPARGQCEEKARAPCPFLWDQDLYVGRVALRSTLSQQPRLGAFRCGVSDCP